jgi:peroxiredoxin
MKRRWALLAGATALAVALLFTASRDPVAELVDQPMPALELTRVDGSTWSLADLRGQVVVLNLWATWCPPCRKEMPALQRLAEALPGDRFKVMGISVDEDRFLVEEYLRRLEIDFDVLVDPTGQVTDPLLAVRAYPETFLIGTDGTLRQRVLGDQEWDSKEWQTRIRELDDD